ncbi:MAG: hypothetical protein RLZZ546_1004 [Bacteroidota bacterium]|jgi:DNA-binding NarL/FixJ family response regulator
MTKILIYEDNNDLRKSLVKLLQMEESFEVVGHFENCVNIKSDIEKLHPSVIIMDIDMPYMTGVEGVVIAKQHFPEIEIIMHTIFEDNDHVFEAISSGANGYLLKNESNEKVISSIKDLLRGGAPMSSSIARKLLKHHQHKTKFTNTEALTPRELEIITELSKGLSYKMAAAKLFISIETVRSHCKKIYEKLQVHSLAEAVNKIKP